MEPRLSSKWIANISFLGSVISLPLPYSSFYLQSTLYQPSPPPLTSIIENVFPSVNIKLHFSKGLQHPSGLVQHCTALALCKCLVKYQEVLNLHQKIVAALEDGPHVEDGQWAKRLRDVEKEARKRVPDFQVVIAFAFQYRDSPDSVQILNPAVKTKTALLGESAQRLLWMYHACLPELVAEARFDIGKLLLNFSESSQVDEELDSTDRLHVVKQLHVLRLLKESDQFVWSGKACE